MDEKQVETGLERGLRLRKVKKEKIQKLSLSLVNAVDYQ